MSTNRSDQEPSMEEILSSIRRIIADDDEDTPPAKSSAGRGEAKTPAKTDSADDNEDDDVLDLTQVVARGKDFDGDEAAASDDADIVEDEIELEPEAAFEPEPEQPVAKPASNGDLHQAERSMANEDLLVSEAAASASTGAFAKLAKAALASEQTPVAGGGKTVEAFLSELLRPMLKEWLDANLETVVERIVEQEVRKLARRAELR
jgi:cell pole-organizing protein PopZ